MTTQEFSNMFDTLLNSYNSQGMFGEEASKGEIVLDEYEKSVLLTQAQDLIVKSYFDRTLNMQAQGFDDSSRRQVDFSSLIRVAEASSTSGTAFDKRGKIFKMPSKILVVLNEKATINGKDFIVIPINYREYDRQMSKPYSQPLKKQCWRLFQQDSNSDIKAELIPINGEEITTYKVRYVERPTPIILTDLSGDNLQIDGVSSKSECSLNPILHMDILNKAVDLAMSSRGLYSDAMKRRNAELEQQREQHRGR